MSNANWRKAVTHFMLNNPAYEKLVKASTTVSDMPFDSPDLIEDVANADSSDSAEIQKYYATALNGNVIVVATTKQDAIGQAAQEVFQKATVLSTAIMTALAKKSKTLYDVDAAAAVISKCGFFLPLDLQDMTVHVDSTSLTLNTAIISSIIGGAASAEALAALNGVLGSLGGQLQAVSASDASTKKIGKLVLWLEEIMTVPLVMIQMYYTTLTDVSTIVQTNCASVAHNTFDLKYHMQGFMFVDPTWINQFTPDFQTTPEYQRLIDQLADLVPTS
jgi:hypothetical protein